MVCTECSSVRMFWVPTPSADNLSISTVLNQDVAKARQIGGRDFLGLNICGQIESVCQAKRMRVVWMAVCGNFLVEKVFFIASGVWIFEGEVNIVISSARSAMLSSCQMATFPGSWFTVFP